MQQSGNQNNGKKSLKDRAENKIDVRAELKRLERDLEELRVKYEQFFLGVAPFAPETMHRNVKVLIRNLMRAPFKNSEMKYKLRTLETRYHTYNTYWQRVLRERENGTYKRDVFKAEMRARHAIEDARDETAVGAADKNMAALFNNYKKALERQGGTAANVDYSKFKKSLIKRARDFRKQNGNKKLTFKVVVKNGKVAVQAKSKE